MKVGDLVKMRLGYSAPGSVIKLCNLGERHTPYAKVMWSDYGEGLEKVRDLEIINESR